VMELLHESVFGKHLGEKETRERIKLSYVWPRMRRDVGEYCKSCEKCQLKARSLVMDRVEITPVPKKEVASKRKTMDVTVQNCTAGVELPKTTSYFKKNSGLIALHYVL